MTASPVISKKGRKRTRRVKVEEIRFTELSQPLKPPPKGTVRIINYGSADGRVGRPRKSGNPLGLVV